MHARTLAFGALRVGYSSHALEGQGLSQYRNFELGSDVASVSTVAGVASSEAKVIHKRPALLQDLEWRPSHWSGGSTAPSIDPVEQILFSFYNDQLFRIVVDYGRERTEGMSAGDMIEAISAVYGTPLSRVRRATSRLETESGSPAARWGDTDYEVVLYRTSAHVVAFRLIVTEVRLDGLARKAETQALLLEDHDAPRNHATAQGA